MKIYTLGTEGSIYSNAKETIKQGIYPAKAVDTTAAGDTFSGYFLAALARGESAEFALDIAAKASAVAVSRMGASSSIPTYAEVCG